MGAGLAGESAFRSGLWIGMRSDESNEQAGTRGAGAGLWPQPLSAISRMGERARCPLFVVETAEAGQRLDRNRIA